MTTLTFILRSIFRKTATNFLDVQKELTFAFNRVIVIPRQPSLEEQAELILKDSSTKIVSINFDKSPEAEKVLSLPDNDFQGRLCELVSSMFRSKNYIDLQNQDILKNYKVYCRADSADFRSILGKNFGGNYGQRKIDGVDTESELTVYETAFEETLSVIRLVENKSSRAGNLKAALKSSFSDKVFSSSGQDLNSSLVKNYGIEVKDFTQIIKTFSYWGQLPNNFPNSKIFTEISFEELLKNPQVLEQFLKAYAREIADLAKSSVSEFEFNFMETPLGFGGNLKKMIKSGSEFTSDLQ